MAVSSPVQTRSVSWREETYPRRSRRVWNGWREHTWYSVLVYLHIIFEKFTKLVQVQNGNEMLPMWIAAVVRNFINVLYL